jgi:hypothetical protein
VIFDGIKSNIDQLGIHARIVADLVSNLVEAAKSAVTGNSHHSRCAMPFEASCCLRNIVSTDCKNSDAQYYT